MNANRKSLHSDLDKVDASSVTRAEYDEIPELDDAFFENADQHRNGVLEKRGRGRPVGAKKSQMNLRIDLEVIEAYRAQGDGWQTRMNEALRDYAKSHGML